MGFVNYLVSSDQVMPKAIELAEKICENGPLAVQRAKEAMIRGRNMGLEEGLRLELSFFEEVLRSEDYQEGIRALKKNCKPEYRGR